jgi:hypothetical protein
LYDRLANVSLKREYGWNNKNHAYELKMIDIKLMVKVAFVIVMEKIGKTCTVKWSRECCYEQCDEKNGTQR